MSLVLPLLSEHITCHNMFTIMCFNNMWTTFPLPKVIMATNRADTLDPALLRPGRLDRKIEFPLPDRRQKRLIFSTITSKMNLSEEVDLEDCILLALKLILFPSLQRSPQHVVTVSLQFFSFKQVLVLLLRCCVSFSALGRWLAWLEVLLCSDCESFHLRLLLHACRAHHSLGFKAELVQHSRFWHKTHQRLALHCKVLEMKMCSLRTVYIAPPP